MPASEDRAISDFPIALQLTNRALVFLSAPDGLGGYDSVHAELTEIGRIILETQYTQDLGNMDVFTAIKNCRVLSGTTNPTSAQGADGQMYVKYQTVSNVDEVVGLYVKLNGEWVEISTGGSGGDVGIECTQAQYDAWEQAGTLLEDTNYYITDGQSGGGVVIDDTTASTTTVYSSDKVEDLLGDKQDTLSFHSANSSSAISVNGTYQIPANVLAHTFIVIACRRGGLGNSAMFKTDELLTFDNGFTFLATGGGYCTLKCSNTGLLTVTNIVNMSEPYILVTGLL